ncbi:MAG: hypothetical protein IT384_24970 [Deltaproteobacteria bacterium]|nr:hypothetical protein [Deltaproteobacteria bacterium]
MGRLIDITPALLAFLLACSGEVGAPPEDAGQSDAGTSGPDAAMGRDAMPAAQDATSGVDAAPVGDAAPGGDAAPSADATALADATIGADAGPNADAAPGADAQLASSVTHFGVTWTFAAPAEVGRFVTGDFWVRGPVTVTAISPPPGGGRNGSVKNLPPVDSESPFDDRVEANRYAASLRSNPPIALAPGDSLVSSISVATPGQVDNWLREGDGERSASPVQSVSVLTCVSAPPPADAFRPAYTGGAGPTWRLADVNRSLLPRLAPPDAVDPAYLEMFADRLIRPWVDNLFFGFDAQVETMPMYGREMGRVAGITSLLLMLDVPANLQGAQDKLLIGFVQHGIDLWGLVTAGHPGWPAFGGHGSGRKWFIALAGALLEDPAMSSPSVTHPSVQFGEDMHTAFAAGAPFGPVWGTGATVIYTGHRGLWNGAPVDSSQPAWGPYEHLPPESWGDPIGENYRRCCTSIAWIGEALAIRLMQAQAGWGHDAFLAYADRWMDSTGDATYTQTIFDRAGYDYRAAWQAQGQAWDRFVERMWAAYR